MNISKIGVSLFILSSIFLLPLTSQAADISLSPQTGSFSVGENFPVRILLDSPGEAANAISGQIVFPVDLLAVVNLSKGPLINFWVEQPNFSNNQGTIRFEGVTFNPGFSGTNGQIATVIFRGKRTGEANIRFQNATVLANDGEGTDITDEKRGAFITISPQKVFPTSSTLKVVAITSPTHPDSAHWYSKRSADFSLSFVSGTEAIALTVDTQPGTIPSTSLKELVSSYKTSELSDGEWYLHARARSSGRWGESSHFLFRIDSQPPQSFPIKLVNGLETTVSRPEIVFGTIDTLSGVNRYEILIDDQLVTIVKAKSGELYHLFQLPYQFWGEKKVQVSAIDNAGNSQHSTVVFTINPNPWLYFFLILLLFLVIAFSWLMIKRRRIVQPEAPKPVVSRGIPPEKSTSLFETSYRVEKDISALELDLKNLIDLKNEQKAFAYLKSARSRQLSDADIHKELVEVGWSEEEIRTLLQEELMLSAIHKKVQDNLGEINEESQEVAS